MTLGEFLDYEAGFFYRQALELDRVRLLMFTVCQLTGSKIKKPEDLFPILELGEKQKKNSPVILTGEAERKALKSLGVDLD